MGIWVKAIKEFDCPSHHLKPGQITDGLPEQVARAGIESGALAESSYNEKFGTEKRETRTTAKRRKTTEPTGGE